MDPFTRKVGFQRIITTSFLSALLIAALGFSGARADRIVAAYDIPANSSGLAWDGNLLWIGGVGPAGEWIRGLNPVSGEIVDSLPAPVPDCIGLACFEDGLAYLSPRSDTTYLVFPDGALPLFDNPYRYMGGLAADDGSLWSATYFAPSGTLLRITGDGRVTRSLPYSGRHSRDLAFHRGRLYIPDRLAQEVRVVNPETGRYIRTFPTPGSNPDGMTSDGEYLYLIDDGDNKDGDRIYCILVNADGVMRLSATSHNYGSVVINDSKLWTLWVYNDGASPAQMVDFEHRNGNDDIFVAHTWEFPRSIQPGDSAGLRITFQPAFQDSVRIEFGLTFDLDRETYWIDLRGKGVIPHRNILIHQRRIDFGRARYGQFLRSSNIRHLDLENNGGEPLTIRGIRFSDESFFYGFYDFPQTFDEPGLYPIPIFFRPVRAGQFNETMTILSDDPDSPEIVVNLSGLAQLSNYSGGEDLWHTSVGDQRAPVPQVRAIQDIEDITGDGLADVVIASNDYRIRAYHAASTDIATAVWIYNTDINPWRRGLVPGKHALSEGGDWDGDGVHDLVVGLGGGAMRVIALSGRAGTEIWTFDTHAMHRGGGAVVVADGGFDFTGDRIRDVYCASAEEDQQHATNTVFLLNGTNGRMIWSHELDASPIEVYRVDDITGDEVPDLIALCADGSVTGIDGHHGHSVWEQEVEGEIRGMFIFGDVNGDGSEDAGFITYMHGITVLNGSNGVELWNSRAYARLSVGVPLNDLNGNGSPDIVYGNELSFVRSIDGRTAAAAWDTSMFLGTAAISMAPLMDFDDDGRQDFIVGTAAGRMFACSGNGWNVLWSYSNVNEGHGFNLLAGSRDIDGNDEMDVFGAMENGTVYCMSGSYVGNAEVDPAGDATHLPSALIVAPAYPNPFNRSVVIPVSSARPGVLELRVMNLLGREIYRARSGFVSAGRHRLVWDGVSSGGVPVPSGTYLVEVKVGDRRGVRYVGLIR